VKVGSITTPAPITAVTEPDVAVGSNHRSKWKLSPLPYGDISSNPV